MVVLVCEGCPPPAPAPSVPQLVQYGLSGAAGSSSTVAAAVALHPSQWRSVRVLGGAFRVTSASLSW